jgi:hypothetical protein
LAPRTLAARQDVGKNLPWEIFPCQKERYKGTDSDISLLKLPKQITT